MKGGCDPVRKSKRVLILMPTLPRYRNRFLGQLCASLRNECDILVAHGDTLRDKVVVFEESDEFKAINLHSLRFKLLRYKLEWQKGLFTLVSRYRPDVVVMAFNSGVISYWIILLMCMARQIPYVLWSSGYERPEIQGLRKKIKDLITRHFTMCASAHICYGTKYANRLREFGIDNSKIFIAQNTIDIDAILSGQSSFDKEGSKKSLGLEGYSAVFLHVGALIRSKNLDRAMLAISTLKGLGYRPMFIIVGAGNDSHRLRELIFKEGLQNDVLLAGPKYDQSLRDYFVAADVFLLPGTGGLAVNEAMAYSLPIISTVGDGTIPDLLEDKRNGFLIHDPSIESIRDACKGFLELSQEERIRMGEESLGLVKERGALANMVDGYARAIRSVCR
jgi:glycosyltransferase involved in cell wall biosynthesis